MAVVELDQRRPACEQRLVRNIGNRCPGALVAYRQQPMVYEVLDHLIEGRGVVADRPQVGEELLAACIGTPLAKLDQSQKRAPGNRLLSAR